MAYTALARRYRSQAFDEVVGQKPIADTLENAIKSNRVAHAYLFVGTRGVGKTTMARLFSKALNGGKPEIDAAIMAGQDTDVIEMDAATHTGVDNVRENLINNAMYKPLRGKFKIYIIDEVHMLSTSSFNALLKIMEEPPEHVVFILCTTEVHKVPPTVRSRCQQFDFRSIPTSLIAQHLTAVIKQEERTADPELIHMVAQLGNGSMRDALSILDRLMAAGQKKLTVKLLEDLLGLPDRQLIGQLIDAVAAADAAQALQKAQDLLSRGTAIDQLLDTLLARLRDLMVLAACGPTTTLVDLSDDARKDEAARAAKFDAAGLVHMIALCENIQRAAKNSAVPRALFDALIVRLAMTEKLADVTALVAASNGAAKVGAAPAKKR
jgi:DNA polymerase-3 subunit gamma/tau